MQLNTNIEKGIELTLSCMQKGMDIALAIHHAAEHCCVSEKELGSELMKIVGRINDDDIRL